MFWRDIAASSSSTAALGILAMPFPPITNVVAAVAAALLTWSLVAPAAALDGES